MNRFIDDVSVLAIEDCLIKEVSELLRSSNVFDMSAEDVSRLAGETTESSIERKRLGEKKKILYAGLPGFKGLQNQRQFAYPAERDPVLSEDVESKPVKTALSSEKASTALSVRGASPVMKSEDRRPSK